MQPGRSSKLYRSAMEKNRRMQMKERLSILSSLIPIQPSKERLSSPILLDEATNYVKQLKENIEVLKRRKEQLKGGESSLKDNTAKYSMLPALAVREIGSTLVVNLITGPNKRVLLHEVFHVLEAEGTAEVVSASYSNVGDKIFYTIYSQAIWSRIGTDTSRVHGRLKQLCGLACSTMS